MKVLHLNLKRIWFDMIDSGEKKEEYREIKPYWEDRLIYNKFTGEFMTFDLIEFRNGYLPISPAFRIEFLGIRIGEGKPEWGAEPGKKYFIISLGQKITKW